jgi:hypothetical protein
MRHIPSLSSSMTVKFTKKIKLFRKIFGTFSEKRQCGTTKEKLVKVGRERK